MAVRNLSGDNSVITPNKRLLLFYTIFLLPIIASLLFVYCFGVNVIYSDQWSMVRFFNKLFNHNFKISELFSFSGDHLIFFPRLLLLYLGTLTHWNVVYELFLNQFFSIMTLWYFFLIFKSQFDNSANYLFWFIPIPYILFSFHAYEGMLWGFQLQYTMTIFFAIYAFYNINKIGYTNKRKDCIVPFVLAIISAIVSSFSNINGLLVWPLAILQLLSNSFNKNRYIYSILFSIIGLIIILIYGSVYVRMSWLPSPDFNLIFKKPSNFCGFLLISFGSALYWGAKLALIIGMGFFLLLIYTIIQLYKIDRLRYNFFWISLSLFSLLTSLLIAIGRSHCGMEAALVSRYTIYSYLLFIGVYVLFIDLNQNQRNIINKGMLYIICAIIIVGVFNSYNLGIKHGQRLKIELERRAFLLINYKSMSQEDLNSLTADKGEHAVKSLAPILDNYNLTTFYIRDKYQMPTRMTNSGQILYALELPNGYFAEDISGKKIITAKEGIFIKLAGWATDDKAKNIAGGVLIDIDGKLYSANYGVERQDVAKHFGISTYELSGFYWEAPLSVVMPKGLHKLSLRILTNDRRAYFQPEQQMIFEVK